MSLYAKIDREALTILALENKTDPELSDNFNKPKWVPVIEVVKPSFDPETHKLVLNEVVSLSSVTRTHFITPLSADEIRDRVDPLQDLADALLAKGVIVKGDLKSRLGR